MDASTIIYIILGLGALILQGYMEKKKKEKGKVKKGERKKKSIANSYCYTLTVSYCF